MIHNSKSRWRLNNPRTVLSIITTITIVSILLVLNRSSSTSEKKFVDIDLLTNFCNQRTYANDTTTKKSPQWIMNKNNNKKSMRESDQVGHMYGEENEFLTDSKGQTVIDNDVWDGMPVKGAIYMLVQEKDLANVRSTIRSIEDRFNSQLNTSYPYIILSSQLIKPEFKKYVRKGVENPERIYFGQIDLEAWSYPYWVDSNRAENAFQRMRKYRISQADSHYYHRAQRYQSGLFFYHPLFDNVEYVWQVEAGTTYTCDMFQEDPFEKMKLNNKKIGFVLTSIEDQNSMYSMFPASSFYMKKNEDKIQPIDSSIMPWLMNSKNEFNYCQMSSSFQIMDMSFLKSEGYSVYFHYLDLVGGYFYERWTDAATRTIAAAMFLKRKDILFLDNVGYIANGDAEHCPFNIKVLDTCTCDYKKSHGLKDESCTISLLQYIAPEKLNEMSKFFEFKMAKDKKYKISP